jgi:hypothetical protein
VLRVLVLVDEPDGVAELVQHDPAQRVVGRLVGEPPVVHGRLGLVDLAGHRADGRPGAVARDEGDPDVGAAAFDERETQVRGVGWGPLRRDTANPRPQLLAAAQEPFAQSRLFTAAARVLRCPVWGPTAMQ